MNKLEIAIEITTLCDAKCIMCPRDEYQFGWKTISLSLYKKSLDGGVENGAISVILCGFGDIFMDKALEEKLVYTKTTYPFVKVFTSSTCNLLIRKKRHLLNYIDTLKISMYGTTKEVYEAIHGGGVKFERVMENIHAILDLPDAERPHIAMNFLVLPQNQHQIAEWKALWENRADEITIWKPHNYGSIKESSYPKSAPPVKKSCGRPFHGEPYVHENGDVSVCCFDNDRKLVIGNLKTQSLNEVLTGKALETIRSIHRSGTVENSDLICRQCDQLTDRTDALVYSSNKNRKVGVLMGHPDLINDVSRSLGKIE